MLRGVALLLLGCAACYGPRPPAGAPCDPAAPACPQGQACVLVAGGGHACGGDPADTPDGPPTDGPPDAGSLGHVKVAAGWRARVFYDFSAEFTYRAADMVDGPETYNNQPDSLFVLRPPFAEALAVIAGRAVFELTAARLVRHDFGNHAPNTAGLPDHLRGGTYVPSLDGGAAALLLASSSSNSGDGSFRVTPQWAISSDRTNNNTRAILWDASGSFDELGVPEGYLGTQAGLFLRSAAGGTPIITGDTKTLHLAGADLLLTRQLQTAVQLVRVTSGTHAEKVIAERSMIELAHGPVPAPHLAWATLDLKQLVRVRADDTIETIAESDHPDYTWEAAAVAAPPHALAGANGAPIIYVIEGNRPLEIDRILAIEPAP